jgi:hypothetical protein
MITKFSKIIFLCVFFCITFFLNCALAVELDTASVSSNIIAIDSNTREVQVSDDSLGERDKGFIAAYKDITGKTGSSIKAKKVETYVRSFSYIHKQNASGQNVLFLHVEFYPNSLQRIVSKSKPEAEISSQKNNLSESDAKKADVLTWLVVLGYDNKNNILIDDASTSDVATNLRNTAKDAGVNISLPLMDLEDVGQISEDDICSLNLDNIKGASKRYNSRSVLVGCIVHTMNGERGQWIFLNDDKSYNWSFYDNNYGEIVQKSLAKVSEIIKPDLIGVKDEKDQNNIRNQKPTKIVMEISEVDSLDKYNEVTSYLKKIPIVLGVDLLKLNASSVKLSVTAAGDRRALISALNEIPEKQLIGDVDANSDVNSNLQYEFIESIK